MPVDHYENFPVASYLLPARLRPAVLDVYRFAREADDIADEGDAPPETRLRQLAERDRELDAIARDEAPSSELFRRLGTHIRAHGLQIGYFRDLLAAFTQDVTKTRYADFGEVTDYCRRSANPVGRLMLQLFRRHDENTVALSDRICTSLQLINFLQDIAADYRRGRIYLAQDELSRHGLAESAVATGRGGARWEAFMGTQITRARDLLLAGAPLGRILGGREGLEIRMIVSGGERILDKLDAVRGDIFRRRPVLGAFDWPAILLKALLRDRHGAPA